MTTVDTRGEPNVEPSNETTGRHRRLIIAAGVLALAALAIPQLTRPAESDRTTGSQDGTVLEASSAIALDPEAESTLLYQLNALRASHGLPRLLRDDRLVALARDHARDMYLKGYFSHLDREGSGPFERLRHAGIRSTSAGENLVIATRAESAQRLLLSSPQHRANMLDPRFCFVGIGVYRGPSGLVVTELFLAWHPYGVPAAEGC